APSIPTREVIMVRPWMIVLGVGLLLLWLAGVGSRTGGGLLWIDFVLGVASIGAGVFAAALSRNARMGIPVALSIALFFVWMSGLALRQQPWRSWWTFAFACGYLLVAALAGAAQQRPTEGAPPRAA